MPRRNQLRRVSRISLTAFACAAMFVAGCSNSDEPGGESANVMVEEGTAGQLFLNPGQRALYTTDQEADGTIRCTESCVGTWIPVTDSPAADGPLAARIGTVDRPDGTRQVTFDRKPLYTFSLDTAGDTKGDNLSDEFNGMEFTWRAARVNATTSTPTGESQYGY